MKPKKGMLYLLVFLLLLLAVLLVDYSSSYQANQTCIGVENNCTIVFTNENHVTTTPTETQIPTPTEIPTPTPTATPTVVPTPTPIPTPTPTPTVIPTPTPIPGPPQNAKTYYVSVIATQDVPGVNTGIKLFAGQHVHIEASGSATYGEDSHYIDDCSKNVYPTTHPDGTRWLNGTQCTTFTGGLTCPNTSVGMLCANFGQGWIPVGSNYDGIASMNTTLYLIYADEAGQYGNNGGAYSVTIKVW